METHCDTTDIVSQLSCKLENLFQSDLQFLSTSSEPPDTAMSKSPIQSMESSQIDSVVKQLGLKLNSIFNPSPENGNMEMEVSDQSPGCNSKCEVSSSQCEETEKQEIRPVKPEPFDGDIAKLHARIAVICEGKETSGAEVIQRESEPKSELVHNLAERLQKIIDG